MSFTKEEIANYYKDGGEKTVIWVKIAEDALDPESDCPTVLRELFFQAAKSNLSGDVSGLTDHAARLRALFESISGDGNTAAGLLSGIFTAVDVFGAVQAGAGNIEYDPKYFE